MGPIKLDLSLKYCGSEQYVGHDTKFVKQFTLQPELVVSQACFVQKSCMELQKYGLTEKFGAE